MNGVIHIEQLRDSPELQGGITSVAAVVTLPYYRLDEQAKHMEKSIQIPVVPGSTVSFVPAAPQS